MKKKYRAILTSALMAFVPNAPLPTNVQSPPPVGNIQYKENGMYYYTFNDGEKNKTDGNWVFRRNYDNRLLVHEYLGEEKADYTEYPDELITDNGKVYETSVLYQFANNEKLPYLIFNRVRYIFSESGLKCRGMKLLAPDMEFERKSFCNNQYIEHIEVSSLCNIGGSAFENSTLREIIFAPPVPDTRMRIGTESFKNCKQLEHIDLPEPDMGIELGYNSFEGSGLKEITLPSCIDNIYSSDFKDCTALEKAVINGDPKIEEYVFEGCTALKDITFGGHPDLDTHSISGCAVENVNFDITQNINGRAFDGCKKLMNFNGKPVLNEDGSIKPEFEEYIRKNFNNTQDIGFINKYIDYRVKKAVGECVTEDMTDMEKLKAVHDKLCSMTTYDPRTFDMKNHVDVSVFLNDSSVCEGYAKAMNLMLHEAGIESCYVHTDTHAWVIVNMGGHYFHVDATWDDGDKVKYDWFMKADSEIKDDPSHKGWVLECPSQLHAFQCEELPECKERMGDVNADGIVDGKDASAILSGYANASAGKEMTVDGIIGDYRQHRTKPA